MKYHILFHLFTAKREKVDELGFEYCCVKCSKRNILLAKGSVVYNPGPSKIQEPPSIPF